MWMEAIMALLDLAVGVPAFEGRTVIAPVERLGAQERLVVLLSRNDPLWSLKPRNTGSRLLAFLFGIEAPHQLADARLETLRRFAVTYRLDRPAAMIAARDAEDAGFSAGQLGQVRRLIDSAYSVRSHRTIGAVVRQAMLALAAILIFSSITARLAPALDSRLVAFVLVAVAFLTIAPFAGQRSTH
jgi:hypothetical protein